MSGSRDTPQSKPLALLKPFAGVGAPFVQRHIGAIVTVVAAACCLPYGFFYALYTPWLLVPLVVPVVILLALAVWALPDSRFLPERTIEKGFFAYVISILLWPNYIAIDLPGLPWITLGRVVNTPLLLIMLITVSTSKVFRERMSAILSASPVVWKALVIFAVVQTISLAFSPKPNFSIAQWVVHQTNHTAVFFLCAYLFVKPGRVRIWAGVLWGCTMIVCAMAILEFHNERPLWSGHVPPLLLINDETVQRILGGFTRSTTGQYRTTAVFTTPLTLSEFMALSLPFVLHFAVSRRSKPAVRLAAAASVPVMLLVILYTDSRLGLIGLFLSIMLYLLYWAIQQWRRDRRALLPPAVLMAFPVVFCVFVAASFTIGRVKAKVWGTGQYDASNQGRIDQLDKGIPIIIRHPFGQGVGMGADVLDYHNLEGVLTIDNYLLCLALEYGLIGLVSFVVMFGLGAYTSTKHAIAPVPRDRDSEFLVPIAIAFVVFLVIKTVLAEDSNHPLMFMMMGILAALAYRVREEEGAPSSAGPLLASKDFLRPATRS